MDVDSPQYEPLENEVMSKEEIKKLKAKEYNEKNKDKNKIKRLEKLVAELEKANIPDEQQLQVDYDRVNELTDKIHKLQMANTQKEIEFSEFRAAVKVIMKYL